MTNVLIVIVIVGLAQVYLLIGVKKALAAISWQLDEIRSYVGEISSDIADGPVQVEVVTVARPKH